MTQSVKGTLAAIVAFLACPCHLPLTLPLLLSLAAGTAFGAWAADNTIWIYGASGILFIGGLYLAYRWLASDADQACPVPDDPIKQLKLKEAEYGQ